MGRKRERKELSRGRERGERKREGGSDQETGSSDRETQNNRDDEGLRYWRQWPDRELCCAKTGRESGSRRRPHREIRGCEEGTRGQDRDQRGQGRRQLVRRKELGGMLPGLPEAGDPDVIQTQARLHQSLRRHVEEVRHEGAGREAELLLPGGAGAEGRGLVGAEGPD